jgi:hypothetical protein
MDAQALLTPDRDRALGQTRAHVLDLLRAAGSLAGVREIADRAALHLHTARFHLDALVDAGLAARAPKPRTTPGRPSMAYRAVEGGGPAGLRCYRLLAEMLTSLIAGMMPKRVRPPRRPAASGGATSPSSRPLPAARTAVRLWRD